MKIRIIIFIIISLIIQLIFYICDIVYLTANKTNINYQWGFNTGGMIFYIWCFSIGIILLIKPLDNEIITKNNLRPVIIMFCTYGIIGVITQIILGFVLNCEPVTFLAIPIMVLITISLSLVIKCVCYRNEND